MKNKIEEIPEKEQMKTLTSCLNSLQRSGFGTQFKASDKGLQSLTTEKIFRPWQVKIARYYRFEGESDPADNSILYAIETDDGEKGTLVDAFGPYSDSAVTKFMQKVEEIHK
jgi:hypothetical protein